MKVAIYHNLPTGGAKRALYELIKRTHKTISYDLYSIGDQNDDPMFSIDSLVDNAFYYPTKKTNQSFPRSLQQRQKTLSIIDLQEHIAADIDKAGYDVVFVHSCKDTHTPGLLMYLKTPNIYFLQEPRRPGFDYNLMPQRSEETSNGLKKYKKVISRKLLYDKLKTLDLKAVRSADRLLCNSYFSLESIARAYGKYATVCYLGIDNTTFSLAKVVNKKNYLVSVGALHPNKGHHLTIMAIARLSHKPALHIVFDRLLDSYKEELEELAQQYEVEVVFHHQISDQALRRLYTEAITTVCTAELEPFGFTPLESLACGTPVVAIKEGGYRETVNNTNGILVNREVNSLSLGIEKMMNNYKNYPSKELSEQTLKQWSWENTTKQYLDMLDSISNGKND